MTDLYTDAKYLTEIASSLPLFKWQRIGEVARCRCILCGDSKKDPTKTRGFFYPDDSRGSLQYKCHNCGESMSFWYFLKTEFPDVYREYRLEIYRNTGRQSHRENAPEPSREVTPVAPVAPEATKRRYDWTYVADLPDGHAAKVYCAGRGLSLNHMARIVYTDNFRDWADKYIGVTAQFAPKDPRLVFPFIDENGWCFGAQGRVFYPCESNNRFKSAMSVDAELGKIFGLERINREFPVIVVEGVIDSLFLPNCVAICGGDINEYFKTLSKNVYVVLDNEPRSKDTVKRMEKAINEGFNVVFWDVDTKLKDINDMIAKGGMGVRDVVKHIAEHSLSGSRAKTKLAFWKKL